MDNEDAEGSLGNEMPHSQAQFPDMSQVYNWNAPTKETYRVCIRKDPTIGL